MSYDSKEGEPSFTFYCKCIYPKCDKDLMETTKRKLPRYKCKKCNMFWKNPEYVMDKVDVKQ